MYEGASGGFYALWHLLLGTDLKCMFRGHDTQISRYQGMRGDNWPMDLSSSLDNVSQHILDEITELGFDNFELDAVYNRHWDVLEKSKWKDSEVWPSNEATSQSDIVNKLYFYANPNEEDFHRHKHDIKIYVYTDIKTQVTLARNKHAWKWWKGKDSDGRIFPVMYMDDDMVYAPVCQKSNLADHMIRLQDIVISNGEELLTLIGGTIGDKNRSHNEMYLNLHTPQERKLLNES